MGEHVKACPHKASVRVHFVTHCGRLQERGVGGGKENEVWKGEAWEEARQRINSRQLKISIDPARLSTRTRILSVASLPRLAHYSHNIGQHT